MHGTKAACIKVLARPVWLALLGVALVGCGGQKVLKAPQVVQIVEPLAAAGDERLVASVDWVTVQNGPGSWASNAYWDEYRLRVENLTAEPVTIQQAILVDSMHTGAAADFDRKRLVKASQATKRRYARNDIDIAPGAGGTGLLAATGAAAGVGAAYGVAAASFASTSTLGVVSTSSLAGPAAAAGAVIVAAPVLIVGGIVKAGNNQEVAGELWTRSSMLPAVLPPNSQKELTVFFPVSPSPLDLRLTYSANGVPRTLIVPLDDALKGLHLSGSDETQTAD